MQVIWLSSIEIKVMNRVVGRRTKVNLAQRASPIKKKLDNFCKLEVKSVPHLMSKVCKPPKQQKCFISIAKLWRRMAFFVLDERIHDLAGNG